MKRIIEILMTRDGLSREEAEDQVTAFNSEMWIDVGQGGDLFEWEEAFSSEFGLEPDFFEDLVL
jgi:hypothetical protein|tara:strand:+ start:452 stop:643 length:192 start_codon:yes stop_codon:yes gene_type:complete